LFNAVIRDTTGHSGADQCSIRDIVENVKGTYDEPSRIEHLSLTFGSGSRICREGTYFGFYTKVDGKVIPLDIQCRIQEGTWEEILRGFKKLELLGSESTS
jgi:hypothetical protein